MKKQTQFLRRCAYSAAALLALSGCTVVSLPQDWMGGQQPTTATGLIEEVETWTGTYETTLPCPDCAGVRVRLALYKDGTYALSTKKMGSSIPAIERRGGFTFNMDETRITLDSSGQGRSFDILPPNKLRMLSPDGRQVTGVNASRFILVKHR